MLFFIKIDASDISLADFYEADTSFPHDFSTHKSEYINSTLWYMKFPINIILI